MADPYLLKLIKDTLQQELPGLENTTKSNGSGQDTEKKDSKQESNTSFVNDLGQTVKTFE
jgi:hypothetical protein